MKNLHVARLQRSLQRINDSKWDAHKCLDCVRKFSSTTNEHFAKVHNYAISGEKFATCVASVASQYVRWWKYARPRES